MAQPPPQVLDLVQRFDRNRDAYRSPHYNETQVRREFLDPLFKALGWDIDNEQGYAEAYKDVVHEDAIKVGEATKAPDYCFRIGGCGRRSWTGLSGRIETRRTANYNQSQEQDRQNHSFHWCILDSIHLDENARQLTQAGSGG